MTFLLVHKFEDGGDGRCSHSWAKDGVMLSAQSNDDKLICGQMENHEWHNVEPKQEPLGCLAPLGATPLSPEALKDVIEAVNHPQHYGGKDNPFEHVKVAEALGWGYHIGNCTKYLWRVGKKANADHLEDLEKARWYLDRFIQMVKRERSAGTDNPTRVVKTEGHVRTMDRSLPGGVFGPHHICCPSPLTDDHIVCRWTI